MKKVIKIGFPIVCISVIGVTFYLLDSAQKKVNNLNDNNSSIVESEDDILNSNDSKEENSERKNNITYSVSVEDEEKQKLEEEKRKLKAIEIIKEFNDDNYGVYYTNEGVEEGRYIVAVRDEETTTAIIYYIVDIFNESIEIYY